MAILILSLILSGCVYSQESPSKGNGSYKAPESKPEDEAAIQQRRLNLFRLHDFAERITSFSDEKIKALALTRLANLVWADDETYARQLFQRSLNLAPSKGAVSPSDSKLKAREIARTRLQIIQNIARRDKTWAARLIDAEITSTDSNNSSGDQAQINIEVANSLVSDKPSTAVEFAERSLSAGVSPWMAGFLKELRLRDEPAANALFLETLNHLTSEPSADARILLYLGTYVFTSPKVNPADPTAVAQVVVGNQLLFDITADRPNIPPTLIRSYLEASTKILIRPNVPFDQRPFYYAAGYLLRSKAERFAPLLVPRIAAAMQSLFQDTPQELRAESAYNNFLPAPPRDLDETLRDIDNGPDGEDREASYLSLVFTFWSKAEYEKARMVAAKIKDEETRAQIATLISFGEATLLLDKGAISLSEDIARKMPNSIEQAVLWLGIARAYDKVKNSPRAVEAINNGLVSARKVKDSRVAFLILNAAGQLAHLDPYLSRLTMTEGIQTLNAQKPETLIEIDWRQRVEAGSLWREFPLKIKGLEFSFDQTLPLLAAIDLEGTVAAVKSLKSEEQQADALVVLASIILHAVSQPG